MKLTTFEKFAALGLALGFTGAFAVGCGLNCTEIGCGQTGLTISVVSDMALDPADEYEFIVDADGHEFTGTCTIADNSCILDRVDGEPVADHPISVDVSALADGMGFSVVVLERVGDPYNGDLSGPAEVSIEVGIDNGFSVADFTPEYTRDEPNGPGCGYCEWAEEEMGLASVVPGP